jgi:hypothetical protein
MINSTKRLDDHVVTEKKKKMDGHLRNRASSLMEIAMGGG